MGIDNSISGTVGNGAGGLPTGAADGAPDSPDVGDAQPEVVSSGDGTVTMKGIRMPAETAQAFCFIETAMLCHDLVKDHMEDTHEKLAMYREANQMMQRMRRLKVQAHKSGNATEMPLDMRGFCKEHNIKWDGTAGDNYHNETEWRYNIAECQTFLTKASDKLRVALLKLKSVVNNLDTSLQGATKAFEKSHHVAKNIAQTLDGSTN